VVVRTTVGEIDADEYHQRLDVLLHRPSDRAA
jgi:hypothetical protein